MKINNNTHALEAQDVHGDASKSLLSSEVPSADAAQSSDVGWRGHAYADDKGWVGQIGA